MSLSDLVLSIADNKQMLGLRYAEWATRAPSLEADIAAAAMGLDDLGHSRVLYGCLEPLGSDPRGPDRESDPGSLRSLPYFDEPWTEWAQFVAANAILDTAFTVMIEAGVNGSVEVLQHRLRKMLMEERYHFLHGRSWLKSRRRHAAEPRVAGSDEWFGPADGESPSTKRFGWSISPLSSNAAGRRSRRAPAVDRLKVGTRRRRSHPAIDEGPFAFRAGWRRRVPLGPRKKAEPPAGARSSRALPAPSERDGLVISLFGTQAMTPSTVAAAAHPLQLQAHE
jgi:hypothetical protein